MKYISIKMDQTDFDGKFALFVKRCFNMATDKADLIAHDKDSYKKAIVGEFIQLIYRIIILDEIDADVVGHVLEVLNFCCREQKLYRFNSLTDMETRMEKELPDDAYQYIKTRYLDIAGIIQPRIARNFFTSMQNMGSMGMQPMQQIQQTQTIYCTDDSDSDSDSDFNFDSSDSSKDSDLDSPEPIKRRGRKPNPKPKAKPKAKAKNTTNAKTATKPLPKPNAKGRGRPRKEVDNNSNDEPQKQAHRKHLIKLTRKCEVE